MIKFAKRRLQILALCIGCTFALSAAAFDRPYSHYSHNEQLSAVLTDFARVQGLSAQISGRVQGVVSGRFDSLDPHLFLQGMQAAYGVHYYQVGDVLYFYSDSEITKSLIKPSSLKADDLLRRMRGTGLVASELDLQVNPQGLLVISGPQNYVDGLLTLVRQFDVLPRQEVGMRVFRLKHAKADDMSVQSSDRTVVIPGLAAILQRMVSQDNSAASPLVTITQRSSVVPGLLGHGLSSGSSSGSGNPISVENAMPAREQGEGGDFSPAIMADSRLNAVIVHDYEYRLPYYAEVIDELDVPLRLVELHAAIVDVDVDATDSLGIDWNASRSSGNWNVGAASGNAITDTSLSPGGGGIFSTVFSTNHSSFMFRVNALEENNKARTLGRPSVLTMDNLEATLEDTTTNYVKIEGYQSSDLFEVVSGTILRVTPPHHRQRGGRALHSDGDLAADQSGHRCQRHFGRGAGAHRQKDHHQYPGPGAAGAKPAVGRLLCRKLHRHRHGGPGLKRSARRRQAVWLGGSVQLQARKTAFDHPAHHQPR